MAIKNSNIILYRNSVALDKGLRLVKSREKEKALEESDQIPYGGIMVIVQYGDTRYVKITDGKLKFSEIAKDGEGGDGDVDASTLNGQNGAYYLNRANQTGSQAISTVTGLQTELDGKATTAQVDGKVAKAGDTMSGGLTAMAGVGFGQQVGTSPQDLSKHLRLWGTTWGINVTSGSMNFNAAANPSNTKYAFYHDSTLIAEVEEVVTNPKGLTTKEYVDSEISNLPATPTWTTISGKPAFVAEGATAAAARTALGLGTAATTASTAYATAAQGALAGTAIQPADVPTEVAAYFASLTGYNAAEVQTLKNNAGTYEWVTDTP